ncbi:MAG: zf-TFIIB domain-containing protein [Meiothermus sp.]|nr:zf-TFIIB domain-containing protein [Meiothermus sp.]
MPLLICPHCETGMNEIQRNGVHIDVCPKCRGVWLDGGEMEKLLGQVRQYEQEYEAELESYRRQQYAPPQTRGHTPPLHPRNPYDTDDDEYYKRHGKKKSKLGRLFDLFD